MVFNVAENNSITRLNVLNSNWLKIIKRKIFLTKSIFIHNLSAVNYDYCLPRVFHFL